MSSSQLKEHHLKKRKEYALTYLGIQGAPMPQSTCRDQTRKSQFSLYHMGSGVELDLSGLTASTLTDLASHQFLK